MTDTEILDQLIKGYHLEAKKVERAKQIVRRLNLELNNRT